MYKFRMSVLRSRTSGPHIDTRGGLHRAQVPIFAPAKGLGIDGPQRLWPPILEELFLNQLSSAYLVPRNFSFHKRTDAHLIGWVPPPIAIFTKTWAVIPRESKFWNNAGTWLHQPPPPPPKGPKPPSKAAPKPSPKMVCGWCFWNRWVFPSTT